MISGLQWMFPTEVFTIRPFKSTWRRRSESQGTSALPTVVKTVYKDMEPTFCRDITLIYNCARHKCGHTSHIRVGAVVGCLIGLVLYTMALPGGKPVVSSELLKQRASHSTSTSCHYTWLQQCCLSTNAFQRVHAFSGVWGQRLWMHPSLFTVCYGH